MPQGRKSRSQIQQARKWLSGGGALVREDSDDELGYDDLPWEWIYAADEKKSVQKTINSKKRKHGESETSIVGAKMGRFSCKIGDTVLLKAADNEAWVGIICEFREDEDDEKEACFMWFSSPGEIRNKGKKRSDFLQNELYLTPSWDWNPLSSINGRAIVLSENRYHAKYPKGSIPKNASGYGKTFICRRGCNTRTATYTNEFIWEDFYTGSSDIEALVDLVESQTKASRKKSEPKPKDEDDVDYIDKPDYDNESHTPRKKQKYEHAITPSSKHKALAPRKFITPTHKRIVTKKALEFTPLGTRVLSAEVISSPYAQARNLLHVSSVPAALPCREEEFSEVYTHLERAISAGTGSCIYIAGTPGTGKTATVREVVAQLNGAVLAEELDDFIFVEINGMKVTDPHQSYALLWEALKGDRVSPSHALDLLEREFSTPSPRRVPCVVLMDELDQLVTKNQSVMYNFFNWPQLRHSRLIVLAVANTMDLPERTLSNKISSRLGLHRITFPGYTHAQLIQIVESRLANVPGNIVHPDAIQFASRKVAAVSGDARRCLDMCRRAVEIAENEATAQMSNDTQAPNTPSKSGRGLKETLGKKGGNNTQSIVTIATIKQAIAEATSSPLQKYLRPLPLSSKVFLAALLARVRRTGVAEASVGDVIDEARRMAQMTSLSGVREVLLLEKVKGTEEDVGDFMGLRMGFNKTKSSGLASRMVGMEQAIVALTDAGILAAETRKGERARRVRLIVGDEEVNLAYREDEEVRGLGLN